MLRQSFVLMIAAGLLALFVGTGSALFTSQATVASGSFTTGTLVLTGSPVSSLLKASDMAPGDKVTAPLTLSNGGSLQLKYTMSTTPSGDGPLGSALQVDIRSGVTDCSNNGFADGSSLYSGGLSTAAISSAGTTTTIAGGGNQVLCFQVVLPSSVTDSNLQGKTAGATFTFNAVQTKNNP